MGKRGRQRARRQQAARERRRAEAEAVLQGWAPASLDELRRLADGRRLVDGRIEEVVDHLVAVGVGWVPIAEALGVSRQAARQAFVRRQRSAC